MKIKMDERAKAARRAYQNAWRRKNKDRLREYAARYWEKRAREMEAEEAAGDPEKTTEAPEI